MAGSISPTPAVKAASPCQPSSTAPQSIELTSPSRNGRSARGIPWTTSSLIDAQSTAGNGVWPPARYPKKFEVAPASAMTRSATALRSAVVTPGAIAARTASSAARTTRPARRILAISVSVLIWIIAAHPSASSVAPVAKRRDRSRGHVFDRGGGVATREQPATGVIADERRGLVGVDLEPVPDRLLAIVIALKEFATAMVADARHGGRIEKLVPHVGAFVAGAAARQPADHLVVIDH